MFKLPTLAYRRARGDMIQVFKLLNEGYDNTLPKLLSLSTTGLRGHKHKLYLQGANRDMKRNFFTRRIINTWNDIPQEIIESKNIKSFEIALDRYWENQKILYDYKAKIQIN